MAATVEEYIDAFRAEVDTEILRAMAASDPSLEPARAAFVENAARIMGRRRFDKAAPLGALDMLRVWDEATDPVRFGRNAILDEVRESARIAAINMLLKPRSLEVSQLDVSCAHVAATMFDDRSLPELIAEVERVHGADW